MNSLLLNLLNEEKEDLIIKDENEIYQITSVYNQNNKLYNDSEITINIGECENILKDVYNINNNETLIIFKVDYFIEGFLIPITEYAIFHPQTKQRLDLDYCNDISINIYIPVSIDEEYLYKYNPESEYYKECENDNLLIKRINEFNNNNLSLCEKNCLFKEYNKDTKKVLCECEIKKNFRYLSEILNKTSELLYHMPEKELLETIVKEILPFSEFIKGKNVLKDIKESINMISDIYQDKLKENIIKTEKNEIIFTENIIIQLSTLENQMDSLKNNKNMIISFLDLKECEDLLKAKNNISDSDSLIMMKFDIKRDDTTSTQTEYKIYNPYTFEQLNLSICNDNDIKIDVYSPVNLNQDIYDLAKHLKEQGYDLFDSNGSFYNDICSSYSSINDTDVILADRKNEFYDSNITLCENNCEYKGFDTESLRAKCECKVKTEINSIFDVKFSPNKVFENFYKIQKLTNIKIITCYELVFSLKGQKNNYGSYTLIAILTTFIIIMIINFITINTKIASIFKIILSKHESMIQEFKKLKNKKDLRHMKIKKKIKNNKKANNNKDKSKILKLKKKTKNKHNNNNPIKKTKKSNIYNDDYAQKTKNKNNKKKRIVKNRINKRKNTFRNQLINIDYSQSKDKILSNKGIYDSQKKNKDLNSISKQNIKSINQIINYIPKKEGNNSLIDDELNDLKYEQALEIDFRSYNQFYLSLLKQSHSLIFTFIVKNDYNIFLLKLSLFLFNFALLYFMNAIFCNDDTMHKLYEDKGVFDLAYEIPKTIYSTIITQIISFLLENLSLSQDDFLNIKKKEDVKLILKESNKVSKRIKIKSVIFFIIGILLLIGFWYYISAFDAVYPNTQIHLIKDTVISFITSLLYPFLLILFPVVFRISSLHFKQKWLYIISKIITKIINIL